MKKKNILKRRKGFTLIELIVVIAILGILAAIVIPRIGGFRDSAERRAVEANHRILVAAAQMYYADTGEWPASDGAVLDAYFDDSDDGGASGYAAFVADSGRNNGSHELRADGIVSMHGSGGTEGTNQWTYTYGTAPAPTAGP